jgi:rare lipoprotein A
VRVTHQSNGRSVVVVVNDRGPFVHGRIIDVTPAAAHVLGFSGLAPVMVQSE